jgi:hypothetical protein
VYNKQLIETSIMVSFNEMHGFYYEFQATLSATVVIASQLIKPLSLHFIVGCAAIYYSSATRPLKLINGRQGHPPFLPVAWDRPAATEPGRETVERATLYSADICRQL